MEGDGGPTVRFVQKQGFLPTPSHGGRPVQSITLPTLPGFLPTPSHGGRLRWCWGRSAEHHISTHALTWRATVRFFFAARRRAEFLPTPSHGGRPNAGQCGYHACGFLPTPSHGGRRRLGRCTTLKFLFLPTPSHGGRLSNSLICTVRRYFYPRPHMEGDWL